MTRLPPSKHPLGLTIYSVSAIFAPAVGPVIGGYLNDNFGWKFIFLINLPPGILMFATLWAGLEREPRDLQLLRRADWMGILTMSIGLGALETVLEEGNKDDWFSSPFITRLAVIAVLALIIFTVQQLLYKRPLLHLRLFARRNFLFGSIANFFFGLSMYGWVYIVPFYLAHAQGYDAEQIGTVLIWIGLPQLVLLPLMPRVVKFVDPRYLIVVGFLLYIGGSLLASPVSSDFSGPQFICSSGPCSSTWHRRLGATNTGRPFSDQRLARSRRSRTIPSVRASVTTSISLAGYVIGSSRPARWPLASSSSFEPHACRCSATL